jgi:WD40 repeat protein
MRGVCGFLCSVGFSVLLTAPAQGGPPARTDARGDPLPDGAIARLGTTRFRAAAGSYTACLSPDGKLVAVAGAGKTIRLLDAATGVAVRSFETDHDAPTAMTFSPDGGVLATTWHDGALRLWDAAGGKALGRIEYKQGRVESFAFSGDGRYVAVIPERGDAKPVVHVCEVAGVKEAAALDPVHDFVHVALSPDGKRAVTWGEGRSRTDDGSGRDKLMCTVQLWDVAAGREERRLETEAGASAAALSPDGKRLALACGFTLQIWDPVKGTLLRSFQSRWERVDSLTFSADGKSLYAAERNGGLQARDVESGRRLPVAAPPAGSLCNLSLPADGPGLGCGIEDQRVRVWELESGKARGPAEGHSGAVAAAEFSADGRMLCSVEPRGRVVHWDVPAAKEKRRAMIDGPESGGLLPEPLGGLFFSPGGEFVCGPSRSGNRLWMREVASGQEAFVFAGGIPANFSPDGSHLVTAERPSRPNGDLLVHVWESATGREVRRLQGPAGADADALAMSPDLRRIAAYCRAFGPGGLDDAADLLVWDVDAGKAPRALKRVSLGSRGGVHGLAFSPDGRLLAASDDAGGLAVLDSEGGRTRWERPPSDEGFTTCPVFSPDGRTLAVATFDGRAGEARVRLWEVASGKVRREFAGHTAPVASLAFSPDGRTLASGSADTTLLLWDASGLALPDPALRKELKPGELDALWADLAADDAAIAEKAIRQLAYAPADSLPFLAGRVRPAEDKRPGAAVLAKLVAALDSDDLDEREKAEKELAALGKDAAPALRQALEGEPTPELKQRAQRLLDKFASPDAGGAALRPRRAVEALERAGTPEAVRLLKALAKGRPDADLTEDAQAALRRLKARPVPP